MVPQTLKLGLLKENKMKNILYFISVIFLLGSCATPGGNGELVGVLGGGPVWYQTDPMVCFIFLQVHSTWVKVTKMFL